MRMKRTMMIAALAAILGGLCSVTALAAVSVTDGKAVKAGTHRQVDATSFMGKLRARTGLTFDLPTEAQWEYTCRAGTDSALNNGKNLTNTQTDSAVAEVARYGSNNNDGKGGYSQHTEVGSYRPNAWGFYDMHGNVAEWCLDWWTDNLSVSSVTDPVGRATGTYRLVRGGCWYGNSYAGYAAACRSAYRSYNYNNNSNPNQAYNYWGFRVACLPAAQKQTERI